ncbi:hypothetical protein B0H14DRAFT_2581919 [Mycena olivaceomarginata]|nr:hypothetical protein B0H14DRAFT_2581919 [Mycena olivaceomarginata]
MYVVSHVLFLGLNYHSSLSSDDEDDKDEPVPTSSIAPPLSQPRPPLQYACDMNAGFEAMDSGSGGTISANFQFAFKATFKSSTYHKHQRVWDKMSGVNVTLAVNGAL